MYSLGIKPACDESGAYAEKLNDQIFCENMLERIYNQISKADLIIAEMTGKNPNVFYEVGYAHALNKKVVLLLKYGEDIPFDLKHFPHIIYKSETHLNEELSKRIPVLLSNPENVIQEYSHKFYINGVDLSTNPTIDLKRVVSYREEVDLTIDINNSSSKYIETSPFQIGIISSHELFDNTNKPNNDEVTEIFLPTGNCLYQLKRLITIHPCAWEKIIFHFNYPAKRIFEDSITLRIFYIHYFVDYTFSLNIAEQAERPPMFF